MEDKDEIAFSSSYKKRMAQGIALFGYEAVQSIAQEVTEEGRKDFLQKLELSAINQERDGTDKAVLAAKRHLIALYKDVGITISEENFPNVFFVPDNKKEEIKTPSVNFRQGAVGGFVGTYNVAVIFLRGDERLWEKAVTIHHEFDHALGRGANVAYGMGRMWTFDRAQTGYHTSHGLKKGASDRGEFLEEGVIETNAFNFIYKSNEEIVKSAREEMFKERGPVVLNQKTQVDIIGDAFAKLGDPFYLLARGTVRGLCFGVALNEGERGLDFWEELLVGRFDPKIRRRLVKRIDSAFGVGTARKLFRIGKDYESAKSFFDELTEKIFELERKDKIRSETRLK